MNEEKTRLIDSRPIDAIKEKVVEQTPAAPVKVRETPLPGDVLVRYLYYPGEQEGGTARRATDPIWSVGIYSIKRRKSQFKNKNGKKVYVGPTLYYLKDGPKRSFVKQELQVVPPDTELPEEIL